MIAKISLIAAFLLMITLPMTTACAATRTATNPSHVIRQAHELPTSMVVAQEPAGGAAGNGNDSDNDNDSNSNDNGDNQNADSNQNDQQQYPPAIPSQPPNGNDQDASPQFDPAPQPQPVNPYQ